MMNMVFIEYDDNINITTLMIIKHFFILDTQEENFRAYKYFSILDSDNSGIKFHCQCCNYWCLYFMLLSCLYFYDYYYYYYNCCSNCNYHFNYYYNYDDNYQFSHNWLV